MNLPLESIIIPHEIATITIVGRKIDPRNADIIHIFLEEKNTLNGCRLMKSTHPAIKHYAQLLHSYLAGKNANFDDIRLCFDEFSRFRSDITRAARSIPYGTTVSYAGLARIAAHPAAVRATAAVMRSNPFPLVIPCHRVIRSNGSIGGFGGKLTGKNIGLKKRLLLLEGVKVD